ncbi:unnamed protein product [Musa acuminata subsp. malaccensis]|uniref:(wild Malaysian banana) hypothetical protein n=1 Tax=Musa acuminata subsp. malaccensis TaxID=214687 RepID=A0A804JPP7_MUSAM|nr:unnamed protein product [Musa acuminata subsp. malaccensis]
MYLRLAIAVPMHTPPMWELSCGIPFTTTDLDLRNRLDPAN